MTNRTNPQEQREYRTVARLRMRMAQRLGSLLAACALVAASPLSALAQDEAGRGALRPFVHVFLAYGAAWVCVAFWVWRIARVLKKMQEPRE